MESRRQITSIVAQHAGRESLWPLLVLCCVMMLTTGAVEGSDSDICKERAETWRRRVFNQDDEPKQTAKSSTEMF